MSTTNNNSNTATPNGNGATATAAVPPLTLEKMIEAMTKDRETKKFDSVVYTVPQGQNYKSTFYKKKYIVDGRKYNPEFKIGSTKAYTAAAIKKTELPSTFTINAYAPFNKDEDEKKTAATDGNAKSKNQILITTTKSRAPTLFNYVELFEQNRPDYLIASKQIKKRLPEQRWCSSIRNTYSNKCKDVDKRGENREDPVINFAADFNPISEKHYDPAMRGKPTTTFLDYDTVSMGEKHLECRPVLCEGRPLTAENAKDVLRGAEVIEMKFRHEGNLSNQGYSDKMIIQYAVVKLKPVQSDDHEVLDDDETLLFSKALPRSDNTAGASRSVMQTPVTVVVNANPQPASTKPPTKVVNSTDPSKAKPADPAITVGDMDDNDLDVLINS
jgi:hypothetical protein